MSNNINDYDPYSDLVGQYDVSTAPVEVDADMDIKIITLSNYMGLPPMKYATPGSSGFDLYAALSGDEYYDSREIILNKSGQAGSTKLIPTGFRMELPSGFEGQVRPRSGLALKNGITVLNSPGTIDSDYRGEIKVILQNTSNSRFVISHGMRIAQMVIAPVLRVNIIASQEEYVDENDTLSETGRGDGGFGSTGS